VTRFREAPTLETERLRLRAFRPSDLEAQARVMGDPQVVRHLGGHTFTREETWRKLATGAGLWPLLGFGYWLVERRADGAYCGQLGFADFKRELEPSIEGTPEMGWIFAPRMHGQGYASEACAAGLRWLDEALPGREATAIISHANAASIRVAVKNGFSRRQEALYHGDPILLFRRPPVR
jgi:RimJ/RimL family protein N-acetyltransferase